MILHGDCLEQLKTLDANSLDSLVTDPPAGISFMGKDWDSDMGGRDHWIAWMTDVMRECMRVLKPGAHGLVWAIPRTSHWTATALENAGFEVRDVVTHLFGSGFPKSMDISKAIDKAAGVEREVLGPSARHAGKTKSTAPISDLARYSDAGNYFTAPATSLAKQWQGWGTALKPASEHWILVRKPCSEKTVAKNVEKWGTGAINIDASRVEGKLDGDPNRFSKAFSMGKGHEGWKRPSHDKYSPPVVRSEGRFPANLVLSHTDHCTDAQCVISCPIAEMDRQSPHNKETRTKSPAGKTLAGNGKTMAQMVRAESVNYPGEGGASRFFYCAKASKSEKNAGLEGMPKRVLATSNHGQEESISGRLGANPLARQKPVENHHPTVKSTKLMTYLITMITPPEGTVLDPFMGSGSTGVAALASGFQFVGIEREPEYAAIAEKRMEAVNA